MDMGLISMNFKEKAINFIPLNFNSENNGEKEKEKDVGEQQDLEQLSTEDDDYEYLHLRSIEKILEDSQEDEESEDRDRDKEYMKYESIENSNNRYKLITKRIDNNRIRNKALKTLEVHTSVCKNVSMNKDISCRSGAIIYTKHQGRTYFCMGVDSCYGDLTDFAGGVKKDETVLEGGLRELDEESQGIFGKFTVEQISDCLSFYCANMMIIFIKLDVDMEKSRQLFSSRVREKTLIDNNFRLEVSDIAWLETSEFLQAIEGQEISYKGRRMYSRVRKILTKVVDIIKAL